MGEKAKGVQKVWERYKFAILILLIGVGLLLWPDGKRIRETSGCECPAKGEMTEAERTSAFQHEIEEILGKISGVGQVQVLLTLDTDGERHLAQDTQLSYRGSTASPDDYSKRSETVLVENDFGEESIITRQVYPTYRGALIVCQGGDRPDLQLALVNAVSVLTGLSSDRIAVAKW